MPRFSVPMSRTATHLLDIVVEATTPEEAVVAAQDVCGNYDFKNGKGLDADYQVEGPATLLPERLA